MAVVTARGNHNGSAALISWSEKQERERWKQGFTSELVAMVTVLQGALRPQQ
jgi:hypothetical protein